MCQELRAVLSDSRLSYLLLQSVFFFNYILFSQQFLTHVLQKSFFLGSELGTGNIVANKNPDG